MDGKSISRQVASEDITVVIQGPLFRNSNHGDGVASTVESVKKYLPHAEIIISTWTSEEVNGLVGINKFIVSDPPEAMVDSFGNVNNFGRQVLSTFRGIEEATRPYVLKIRADHKVEGDQLFLLPSRVNSNNTYAYFSRKIIITSFFVRDPLKIPFLFHISDLVQFGAKADMLRFWGSKIPSEESMRQKNVSRLPRLFGNFAGITSFRELPEQTLTRLWLEREGLDVYLDFPCTTDFRLFSIWEKVLTENFEILDFDASGIRYPDRFHAAFLGKKTVVTEQSFKEMQSNPGSMARYFRLLLAKYIICWFVPRYWIATANVIVTRFLPRVALAIRMWLRSKLGLTHPDRR